MNIWYSFSQQFQELSPSFCDSYRRFDRCAKHEANVAVAFQPPVEASMTLFPAMPPDNTVDSFFWS
eukprot:snap_masked-scaffold_1-processed-gene-14.13-mRNA-1 protein AED:1.00 eAED:1.00 QI:0/0/0/0/1/1/2/0/65